MMSQQPKEPRRPTFVEELQVLAGSELPAGRERGFRRLTLLVSAVGFAAGVALGLFWLPDPRPELRFDPIRSRLALTIMLSLGLGGLPWGVFFTIRWLVRGFRG